ncbi:hypothetical protein [Xanthobacter sediminis]
MKSDLIGFFHAKRAGDDGTGRPFRSELGLQMENDGQIGRPMLDGPHMTA